MHFARLGNADKSQTRGRLDSLISVTVNANKNCSRGLARHLRLAVWTSNVFREPLTLTAVIFGKDWAVMSFTS